MPHHILIGCVSFLSFLLFTNFQKQVFGVSHVMLVVPGLGRPDRLSILLENLQLLSRQQRNSLNTKLPFTINCVVYIYAARNETSFWSEEEKLTQLSKHCNLIENPNKKYADHLYMMQPATMADKFDYVFILLDDVVLESHETFNLQDLLRIMRCSN